MIWFQALPGLVTAILAIYAVTAWRRDFLGRRRIELAEEVLALFYRARDAIHDIRIIGLPDEKKSDNPIRDVMRERPFVPIQKHASYSELFARLQAVRYQFMARFGEDKIAPFNELDQIVQKLNLALRMLNRAERGLIVPTPEKEKTMKQAQAIAWESSDTDDVINPRLDRVISNIEKITRPIIDPPRYWHDLAVQLTSRLRSTKGS
jgi:hypothetical protein